MSIFHWPDSNGEEVCRYADHLAEVERVRAEAEKQAYMTAYDVQGNYDAGAEAMRAAIYEDIAENVGRRGDVNAETVLAHIKAVKAFAPIAVRDDVLAALREVEA